MPHLELLKTMRRASPCRLPPEITDYIIDFLHDDPVTLASCTLVSRSWLSTARKHFFRRIVLRTHTDCRGLHALLSSTPELSHYISELVIKDDTGRMWGPETLAGDQRLLDVLSRLNLTSLEVGSPPRTWMFDFYNLWSTKTMHSFSDAVQCKSINELRVGNVCLERVRDLMRFIRRCGLAIKVLHLENLEFESGLDEHPDSVFLDDESIDIIHNEELDFKTKPETLILGARLAALVIRSFIHPRSPIRMDGLKHLDLRILKTAEHYAAVAALLEHTPLLEDLEIQLLSTVYFDINRHLVNPIDLSHVPQLKRLILRVELLLGRSDPLPFIHTLLSTLPATNSLEEIFITTSTDHPPPFIAIPLSRGEYCPYYARTLAWWRSIDELLVEDRFACLKIIRVDFEFDDPFGASEEAKALVGNIWDGMVEQLVGISRGVLEFDSAYL